MDHGKIVYKIDILDALKKSGISTYKMRKEKIFTQSTIDRMKTRKQLDWITLAKTCEILDCQVGDLIEYDPAADPE